jgi:hypothetical protein
MDVRIQEMVFLGEALAEWPIQHFSPQYADGNLSLRYLCGPNKDRPMFKDTFPTITEKSKIIMRVQLGHEEKHKRYMLLPGYALLQIQGWPFPIDHDWKQDNKLLTGLAGNCFSAYQFLPVFLSGVARFK